METTSILDVTVQLGTPRVEDVTKSAKVCCSGTFATLHSSNSVVMAASFTDLFAATTPMKINGKKIKGHVDTVYTKSFICELLVQKLRVNSGDFSQA